MLIVCVAKLEGMITGWGVSPPENVTIMYVHMCLRGVLNPSPQKPKSQYLTDYNSESSSTNNAVIFFMHISAGTIFYLITDNQQARENLSEENRVSHLCVDKGTAG